VRLTGKNGGVKRVEIGRVFAAAETKTVGFMDIESGALGKYWGPTGGGGSTRERTRENAEIQ